MANNQTYRDQVADLILLDSDGKDLVISSPLKTDEDGFMTFEVRQDVDDGDRYNVTIKIEEV